LRRINKPEKMNPVSPYGQSLVTSGYITPSGLGTPGTVDAQRAIESYQRKQEYNRQYYQTKTKPKKEDERKQLEQASQYNTIIVQLQAENTSLRTALDIANRRITELMMMNVGNILPSLAGLVIR
jgi:hypothetical protein